MRCGPSARDESCSTFQDASPLIGGGALPEPETAFRGVQGAIQVGGVHQGQLAQGRAVGGIDDLVGAAGADAQPFTVNV